jgi:hypothetical protein
MDQALGFAACATGFLEQGEGLLEVSGRVLVAAQPQVDNAKPGQRPGFAVATADRAGQVQGLLVTGGRALGVRAVCRCRAAERAAPGGHAQRRHPPPATQPLVEVDGLDDRGNNG